MTEDAPNEKKPSTTVTLGTRYGHFSVDDLREDVESMGAREKPEAGMGYPRNPPQSDNEKKRTIN